MTTKFTPGPWNYDPETMTVRVREWKNNEFMGDYKGSIVCGFEESHGGAGRLASLPDLRSVIDANGHLLSAAPEMYEALNAIIDSADDGRDVPEWLTERLVAAVRALAKAEGAQ